MNTQACARTRANTSAHVLMRTHPRYGGACTQVHATRKHMHAGIRTMHMHVYARARANTPAHVHALVQTHAHIFWLRAKRIGAVLLSYELCLGRPYLSLAVWPCLYCTHMATPPVATLVIEAEWPRWPLSVEMVAQLEASCWACHAMHKVVVLASSLQQPLAGWRISAV